MAVTSGIVFSAMMAGVSVCSKRLFRRSSRGIGEGDIGDVRLCKMCRTPTAAKGTGREDKLSFFDSNEQKKISRHRNGTEKILR